MPSKIKVRGPRVNVTAVIVVVPVICTRLPVAVLRFIVAALAIDEPVAHSCAALNVLAPSIAAVPTTPAAGKPVQLVKTPDDGVPSAGVVKVGFVSVLLVNVSVVALPTRVSVLVGSVNVPVLTMLEMTGAVRVLFVSVSVPVGVT